MNDYVYAHRFRESFHLTRKLGDIIFDSTEPLFDLLEFVFAYDYCSSPVHCMRMLSCAIDRHRSIS